MTTNNDNNTMKLRASRVQMDGLDGDFACYVEHDAHWNGFACPWFTQEEAQRVIGAMHALGLLSECSQVLEAPGVVKEFVCKFAEPVDLEPWRFEGEEFAVLGRLFPVGNRGWCWSEVGGSVNPKWPLAINGIEDLRTLLVELKAFNQVYHFDDNPAEVVWLGDVRTFNDNEAALLRKLMKDCERFGGVWKMMEEERSQECHKLMGIAPPEPEEPEGAIPAPAHDPAAVFGVALSLHEAAAVKRYNVSEAYNGADEFMRQCMRVGEVFERWACANVDFDQLDDVWPYLLQDKFHEAVARLYGERWAVCGLREFSEFNCPMVAKALGLTMKGGA